MRKGEPEQELKPERQIICLSNEGRGGEKLKEQEGGKEGKERQRNDGQQPKSVQINSVLPGIGRYPIKAHFNLRP